MTFKTRLNRLNRALTAITVNRYFEHLPIGEIAEAVRAQDFDTDRMDGIYCGHEGREKAYVGDGVYVHVTWYRMSSGRFEVISYAAKGTPYSQGWVPSRMVADAQAVARTLTR
jgi:hypothetical protein